jgi:hypothetical protein
MKRNLFDEHIKEQMAGLKPDVGAHIWDKIAKKMEQKKPHSFWSVKRLSTLAVLLLLIAGAAVYFTQNNVSKIDNNIAQYNPLPTKENNTHLNSENINTEKTADNSTAQKNTTESIPKTESGTANVINEEKSTTKNNTPTTNENSITTSSKKLEHNNKNNSTAKNNATTNNEESFLGNSKNTNKKTSFITKSDFHKKVSSGLNNNKQDVETTDDNSINGNKKSNLNNNSSTLLATKRNNKSKITNNYSSLLFLSTNKIDATFLSSKTVFNPTIIDKKLPIIPCPEIEKNIAGKKTYIDIYGGPDYIFRSFSDTGKIYLQQRKASTGIQYAFSAGVRYTKVLASGVSLRAGINYSQMNENLVAFNGYILERVIRINSTGDTIANFTQSNIQYKKTMNVYRSFDIPLQLGYEMGNGRLHTNISIGAMLNLTSKQVGSVLDNKGNPVNITSGQDNNIYQFKSNMGVSFLGSVSFFYKLNDQWHIMAEPYIRYSLAPFTKPDITLKQKFNAAGIRFGIRRDF